MQMRCKTFSVGEVRYYKTQNYKLLEDYDDRNYFDVEEYMKKGKAKLNKNSVLQDLGRL